MRYIKEIAWYGSAVALATVMAIALLLAGPADRAEAASSISGSTVVDELSLTITVTGLTGGNDTDEVQTLAVGTVATGGTYTLSFNGQTTAGIAFNANAAAVDTALELLSTIPAGGVAVASTANADTGIAQTDFVIVTFSIGADVPAITADITAATGAANFTSTETTKGVASTDVVTATIDPTSTGGAEFTTAGAQSIVLLDAGAKDTNVVNDTVGIAIKAKSPGVVIVNVAQTGAATVVMGFTVTAATVVSSITLGTPSPTAVPASGGTGADIAVTLKTSTGTTITGVVVTVTTSLGVVASNGTACDVSADGTEDTGSDAKCTFTSAASDVIEVFGNDITGTITVTVTAGGVTATKTVTLTGGTVASIELSLVKTNTATSFSAKGIVADRGVAGDGTDELIVVARTLDANGNSIISGDVKLVLKDPAGNALNLWTANAPGIPEAGGLTVATNTCDTSINTTTATCIDTPQIAAGKGKAGAVGFIDVDKTSTTALTTGTYTVTATHGTGTALKTATATFVVAAPSNTVAVSVDSSSIAVGGTVAVTATVTDANGNSVADGTTVTWTASTSLFAIVSPTTGGVISSSTTSGGVATANVIGLADGAGQVFALSGAKTGSGGVTVGTVTVVTPTSVGVAVAPPAGGLTQVVSGTTDIQALIGAQSFSVLTVFVLDVGTQTFLRHVVGGPAVANTLVTLGVNDIVTLTSQ